MLLTILIILTILPFPMCPLLPAYETNTDPLTMLTLLLSVYFLFISWRGYSMSTARPFFSPVGSRR
jgi:hypothetical protein